MSSRAGSPLREGRSSPILGASRPDLDGVLRRTVAKEHQERQGSSPVRGGSPTRVSDALYRNSPTRSRGSSPNRPASVPLRGFFKFSEERRPQLIKMHPRLSIVEIASLLGREWSAMPEAERERYLGSYAKFAEANRAKFAASASPGEVDRNMRRAWDAMSTAERTAYV